MNPTFLLIIKKFLSVHKIIFSNPQLCLNTEFILQQIFFCSSSS